MPSFYQRHRELIDAAGRRTTIGVAGAGGSERVAVVVVPSLVVEWGHREVSLSGVPVYVSGQTGDCRLGLDAFAVARALRLDAGRFLLAPVWKPAIGLRVFRRHAPPSWTHGCTPATRRYSGWRTLSGRQPLPVG